MPLYSYNCPEHGVFDSFNTLADRRETQCPACGKTCNKLPFARVQGVKEFWPYYDHGIGSYIASRKQREQEMKKRGLVEHGSRDPDLSSPKPKPIELPNALITDRIELS